MGQINQFGMFIAVYCLIVIVIQSDKLPIFTTVLRFTGDFL